MPARPPIPSRPVAGFLAVVILAAAGRLLSAAQPPAASSADASATTPDSARPVALRSAASGNGRLNFLFLFADDQRADTVGAWGNPAIRTPHLDRLVSQGFSFRGNYCFGGNSGAVCIPSRAMLMSGRTWFRVDHDLGNAVLLPEVLRRHGYRTFGTGKWHNGRPSFARGFQAGQSVMFGGMSDHNAVPVVDLLPDGTYSPVRTAGRHSTDEFAEAAARFLEQHQGPEPFFAYVAFTAPHDPRDPPASWMEPYRAARPPLPANYLPQHPFDNGQLVLRDENLAAWPRSPDVIREQLAEYYGLISHLEAQVGRILEVLERSPHAANTVVIYAADHGLAVGSHGLLGKQNLYEHSMRCPLILRGPGIPAGASTSAFTYLLDLMPTVCGLARVPVPDGVEGLDLAPLWMGTRAQVRDSVFLPYLGLMRAVRDERWKLICYPPVNHLQLFDLENDPHELGNLAADPAHAGEVQRMLALMRTWQDRVGDTLSLTNASPKPLHRDLTGLAREPDAWQPEWIRRKYFGRPEP